MKEYLSIPEAIQISGATRDTVLYWLRTRPLLECKAMKNGKHRAVFTERFLKICREKNAARKSGKGQPLHLLPMDEILRRLNNLT